MSEIKVGDTVNVRGEVRWVTGEECGIVLTDDRRWCNIVWPLSACRKVEPPAPPNPEPKCDCHDRPYAKAMEMSLKR